jgi:hypothetical protein
VRRKKQVEGEGSPKPKHLLKGPHRLPNKLLMDSPVDLLTIEQGHATKPPLTYERNSWEKLISRTKESERPRVVIESWPPNSQLWTKGPACKSTTTRWQEMSYVSRYKRVSATDVGGGLQPSPTPSCSSKKRVEPPLGVEHRGDGNRYAQTHVKFIDPARSSRVPQIC